MALEPVSNLKRISAEGLWVVAGQFASAAGAIVGVRWMTELLPPSEYGKLALGLTLVVLANQTLFGPLGNGIGRFYSGAREHGDMAGYLRACGRLTRLAVGALLALIVVLIGVLAIADIRTSMPTILAATAFAIFSSCGGIAAAMQGAARQRSIVAGHQALDTWARFAIAAAFMTGLGATSAVALAGYSASSALVLGSQLLFLSHTVSATRKTSSNKPPVKWTEEIVRFSWPISTFGFFTWLQMSSDRWALAYFAGAEQVGYYEVLSQLGYAPMVLGSGILVQLFAPILFEQSGISRDALRNALVHRTIRRMTMVVCATTIAAALFGFAFSDAIFRIAASDQYRPVAYLLPWMIISGGVFSAGQSVALHFMTELNTRRMLIPKIATALIGVAANGICAYAWGLTGVVFAGLAFSILYFCWITMAVRRSVA